MNVRGIHKLTRRLLLEWRRLLILQEAAAAAAAAMANTTTLAGLLSLANIEARLADISSPDVLAAAVAAATAGAAAAARITADTTTLALLANIEADLANIEAHLANISSPDVLAESSSSAAEAEKWRRRRRRRRRTHLLADFIGLANTEANFPKIKRYLANIAANIEENFANMPSQYVLVDPAVAAAAAAAAPAMAKTKTLKVKTESECEQCSICLDYYIVGTILRKLPCNHMFHDECVSEWIQRPSSKRNCPVCRYQL